MIDTKEYVALQQDARQIAYLTEKIIQEFLTEREEIDGAIYIGSGDGAVGAGSVVTHDVPAKTVAAGNPAKVIKKNYNRGKVNGANRKREFRRSTFGCTVA